MTAIPAELKTRPPTPTPTPPRGSRLRAAPHGLLGDSPPQSPTEAPPDAVLNMLSGRYEVDTWSLNAAEDGGVVLGAGVSLDRKSTGNPLIDAIEAMKIELNIDVDGLNPTFAVSGTVTDQRFVNSAPSYFIGRATTAPLPKGIRVKVSDFRLVWPVSEEIFEEAEIVITNDKEGRYYIGEKPGSAIASIAFSSNSSGRSAGVFSGRRRSRLFRQLRLFVLREEGASNVEPHDTSRHPHRPERRAGRETLSVVNALREAGVHVYRLDDDRKVDETLSGDDGQWNESEGHDALPATRSMG